ncbi:hypothetical protein M758_6G099100 [Ceratodon purpureus]|uniref:Uncharacterized protein n=1 Tax=Ceratodon purpureus TaxID=3225 RepID=A0A8T0HG62_CERPU|nr:hypothetical protein KC19_6G102800 [Ceratodon purpureus]KAG0613385.1 hypothetical protein M758_6G099100 [Ceratodon purpureus]
MIPVVSLFSLFFLSPFSVEYSRILYDPQILLCMRVPCEVYFSVKIYFVILCTLDG